MIKILGILDLLAALIFLLTFFFSFNILIWIIGIYLILKGAIFLLIGNIISLLDVISGILILSSLTFSIPAIVILITSGFLIQKGVFSLL